MTMGRFICLFVFLFVAQYVPAQLNWTALNGPIGLNEQTPSTSASGIVFLNRKNVHQFDISFDYGDTWEAHDLSLNTFPFSYQILQLTNDQTYVLLNDRLNAFRQNTKSWEPLPGFDDSKRVWFDGSNRLWRVLADGQLSYSDNEGNSFTTVFTDVANSTLLAMYNDAHNLMVEHDAPSVKVYHFTSAGQKQFISFAANNFYVDWIKYNPYTGTAFMKTNDPLGYIKKSTDGGLSWTAVDFPPDFPGIYVTDLLFTNAGETWAVTGVAALISTNEGNTWSPFPPIFPEDYYAPGTLGLSANGQKVYYYVSYCGKQGFYRSLNHGVSWTDLTPKFYFPEITDIVKTNDGTLYAEACRKFNVEVSTNEGQSWQTWTISTPNGLFTPVSICKSPDGTLYVPGEGVVYRSTNNGANWDALDFSVFTVSPYHKMSAGLDGSVYLFHHQHGGGFSMDKGETWTEMLIPPDFSSQLYFGDQFDANGNFYRSGQYFISKFIPSINYTDNVVLPGGTYIEAFTVTGTGRLLVMTTDIFQFSQILYYSDDEGQSFQQSGPIPEWSTPARLISGPGMVLLQVNGNYYRSLDDGITWSLYFSTNAFQSSISCLYFSPDNYLYAGLNGEVIHRTGQKVVASKEPVDQWVKLSVYPNPATEKLSIQIPFDGLIQYTISDALGRTMLNSRTDIEARSNLNVDIQHLASGAYFIEVRDESGLFFGKSTFYKQ